MADSTTRVMFFCLGNICRSPLAEALFRHKIDERGFSDRFEVASSGTGGYHVGEGADPGSRRVARERLGDDLSSHSAQQLDAEHLRTYDVLVAMDESNRRNARSLAGADEVEFLLIRDFEPDPADRGADVPDPWGGGGRGFERVYEILDRCIDALIEQRLLS
jgi:protein-tyrosine phosphatase